MVAKATVKYLKVSPQKVRLVADQIRGKSVEEARSILKYSKKKVARDLHKLLMSAVANAKNATAADSDEKEKSVDIDSLFVRKIFVDPGPVEKRVRFRAMGRVFRILHRSSHISLELDKTSNE